MPRRRSYVDRPRDHLTRAAARHAAIDAGTPHEAELAGGGQAEPELSSSQRRARAQQRDRGGKFK